MNAIPPQKRFTLHRVSFASKAVAEARRAGVKLHTPKAEGRALLPSYGLASGHVPNASYIRPAIGQLTRRDLKPLYDAARKQLSKVRRRQAKQSRPLQPGEAVIVTRGAFEGITATISRIENKRAVLPTPLCEAKVPLKDLRRA